MSRHLTNRPLNAGERSIIGWTIGGLVVSLAIAVFGLEDFKELPAVFQLVTSVVPAINRWASVSANPNHTLVFFSIAWLLTPCFIFLAVVNPKSFFPQIKLVPLKRLFVSFLGLGALSLAIAFFGFASLRTLEPVYDGLASLPARMLASRISTGLFGGLLVFITWYSIAALIVLSVKLIRGEEE